MAWGHVPARTKGKESVYSLKTRTAETLLAPFYRIGLERYAVYFPAKP